jgi:hypothetical protein
MKLVKSLAVLAVFVGVVGLLGSTIAPQVLRSRAQLVQRITPYDKDTAALTGEPGDLIGEPQLMVIEDQAAFLPGTSEKGARLADDNYLRSHSVYPLQMKTVGFVAGLARLASAGFGLAGLALLLFARRRTSRHAPTQ